MSKKDLAGLFLLSGLLSLTACNSTTESAPVEAEAIKVQVAMAELRDVEQLGTFTGTIEAEISNNIAPQSAGRIKRISVEVGDHVAKGQILAEMDAINLDQSKLQMENNQIEFDRVDELYKVGGISKSTWDQKKLSYDLSKASYENILENTYLRSPIGGMVTQRNYDTGDMWSMGAPIYTVEQIRPVKLMVHVSESLYTKVKKGMEVNVTLDVYGDEDFTGVVKLIHPSIDPSTRTFPVEVNIPNRDERIRPGMFARVIFNYGTESRVMIPDRAILKQSGSADRYVYTCKDGIASYKKIVLGRRVGEEYEIMEGIEPGEQVAITAMNRLDDGTSIEIVNP